MATNKDLLKEAIADAKAIRESALANAKAALEEAFTPQLKNMLSEKIQEITEEENEMKEMEEKDEKMEGKEELEELNLDELLAELESLEEDDTLNEADDAEEKDDESKEDDGDDDEDGEEEEITRDEIEAAVIEILTDLGVEFSEAGEEAEDAMDDAMPSDEGDEGEEELEEMVDVQSLLEELGVYEEDDSELEEGFGDRLFGKKDKYQEIVDDVIKTFSKEDGALLQQIKDAESEGEKNKLAQPILKKVLVQFTKAKAKDPSQDSAITNMNQFKKDLFGDNRTFWQKFFDQGVMAKAYQTKESKELSEALKTVESLRSEINEVNLLNAKLLYTNRIFNSKNLSGNQKAKVLDTFDKATTVNEVKLIHETLSNSLNTSKKSINESVGSASRAMGTTKAKPIINENDAFARMRELAFYDQKH